MFNYHNTIEMKAEKINERKARKDKTKAKKKVMRFTPDKIRPLRKNEIFVFGSNTEGKHLGGAARLCRKFYGAEAGVSEGMTGKSYAIPTMSINDDGTFTLRKLKASVVKFIKVAKNQPELVFIVTKIGCGIAGYTPDQIAPYFKTAIKLDNVILPEKFYDIIIGKNEKK